MQTPAGISKHPVHPVLVVVPVGLWAFSLFCDLLYLGGLEAELWSNLALFAMVAGFVGVLLAVALSGFLDLTSLTDRRVKGLGVTYLNLALILVALYAVNIWLRFSDPASLAVGIGLSAIGLGALSASSFGRSSTVIWPRA